MTTSSSSPSIQIRVMENGVDLGYVASLFAVTMACKIGVGFSVSGLSLYFSGGVI